MNIEVTIKDELKIEPSELHLELIRQPQLFWKYSEDLVQASSYRDELKNKIEYEEARLSSEIRATPERFGVDRVTEGSIASAITLQESMVELKSQYLEAKEAADRMKAMIDSIQQKKVALENLCSLWIAKFWSEVKMPEETTADASKQFAKGLADRFKKRGANK